MQRTSFSISFLTFRFEVWISFKIAVTTELPTVLKFLVSLSVCVCVQIHVWYVLTALCCLPLSYQDSCKSIEQADTALPFLVNRLRDCEISCHAWTITALSLSCFFSLIFRSLSLLFSLSLSLSCLSSHYIQYLFISVDKDPCTGKHTYIFYNIWQVP